MLQIDCISLTQYKERNTRLQMRKQADGVNLQECSNEDIATLLIIILKANSYQTIAKETGMEEEAKRMAKSTQRRSRRIALSSEARQYGELS